MARIFTKAQVKITCLQLKKKILYKLERFFPRIDSNRTIYRFLERNFTVLTESYKKMPVVSSMAQATDGSESAAIWVFWWQGYDNAPPLVKKCIDSIRLHAGNHPVILLTQENCKQYAELPEYIWEKTESGIISLTHFSDILRMKLLSAHGGMWLDATVFVSEDIPKAYFQQDFFTIKYPSSKSAITKGRWTGFCQAAKQGSLLHRFCLDVFLAYWNTYSKLIDYFFIDYVVAYAYAYIPAVHTTVDAVSENNIGVHELDRLFFLPYSADTYEQAMRSAVFHKLNWKRNYPEKAETDEPTAYRHFMQQPENWIPSPGNEETVSVIIPTYNRAHLIEKSVRSVLAQTYHNLEVIVVDDCSTDNTEEVVKSISDSRVAYVRLPHNSGACAARNEGIQRAAGAYIAFNDSDDQWASDKICRQLEFLSWNHADIVVCKMKCMTPDGTFLHIFPNKNDSARISYEDLLHYNCASTQTFFGKASCFKDILFDSRMPRMQDWDEALRLSQKYTVFFQDEVLVHTFIQPDSISTHPEKGVRAMELLWEKHRDAITGSRHIAESFLKKKASFLCRTGTNPTAEMQFLMHMFPSVKNRLKYLLAKTGLYKTLILLKYKM